MSYFPIVFFYVELELLVGGKILNACLENMRL